MMKRNINKRYSWRKLELVQKLSPQKEDHSTLAPLIKNFMQRQVKSNRFSTLASLTKHSQSFLISTSKCHKGRK